MYNPFKARRQKSAPPEIVPAKRKDVLDSLDPLDTRSRWGDEEDQNKPLTVRDFPFFDKASEQTELNGKAMDSATIGMDSGLPVENPIEGSAYAVPAAIAAWYNSMGFIGYQSCAIIAQHWLVDKACSMPGEDAVRNGWTIKAKGDDVELDKEDHDRYLSLDVPFDIRGNLVEFNRFKNIFGIRVALFVVDSDDPKYYEKPFNPDGIMPGSYRGISQVDPYWMTPIMTMEATSDPSNMHFYDPEFWVISGRRYHRSHLMIARGPQPADILKPTYIFGGIPLVQRIYERVYAAERTANEAPLLAMNKRTTAIHLDTERAVLNQAAVEQKIALWVRYRDNHAVKILGLDETMDQYDTSLADFDSVIMSQFQLVAAIAEVPATKLLGTSPKGFNATGEFEMQSYHEELESLQVQFFQPMLERHYMLVKLSLEIPTEITIVFESVDSVTTQQKAELNGKKAETDIKYIDAGVVSPDEIRQKLRDDKHSGYSRLTDDSANTEPGMSPENIANFEKAGAQEVKAQGAQATGEANLEEAGAPQPTQPPAPTPASTPAMGLSPDAAPKGVEPQAPRQAVQQSVGPTKQEIMAKLQQAVAALVAAVSPASADTKHSDTVGVQRTTSPGVEPTAAGHVSGVANVVKQKAHEDLPVISMGGLTLSIENPAGSIRSGEGADGQPWSIKMPFSYGFINGTEGADGEEMDCFVGPNPASPNVYIIDQGEPVPGGFDEHKVMLGFDSEPDAVAAYRASYSADWNGVLGVTTMGMTDFVKLMGQGPNPNPLSQTAIAATSSTPQTE